MAADQAQNQLSTHTHTEKDMGSEADMVGSPWQVTNRRHFSDGRTPDWKIPAIEGQAQSEKVQEQSQ